MKRFMRKDVKLENDDNNSSPCSEQSCSEHGVGKKLCTKPLK